jgi:hypothetical protein
VAPRALRATDGPGGFTDISALDRKGELDRLLAVAPSPTDAAVRL